MYDGDLRKNLIVSTLFDSIKKLIEDLEEFTGEPGSMATVDKTDVEVVEQTSQPVNQSNAENTEQEPDQTTKEAERNEERKTPSPEYHSTNIDRSNSPSTSHQVAQLPSGHVSCPICNENVLELNVNLHLDKCLKKTNSENPKRKPIPMPIFGIMKRDEIKKRCKELGLEMTGDKDACIARIKEFIVIWNSTCDDDDPLERSAILKSIRRNEFYKNKNQTRKVFNFDAKTDQSVIDSSKEKYIKENKGEFDKLIAKAKLKRGQPSSTVTNNNTTSEIQNGSTSEIQNGSTPKRKTPPVSEMTQKTNEDGQTPSKKKKQYFNFPSVTARLSAESAALASTSGGASTSLSGSALASTSTSESKFPFKTPTKTVSKVTCPVCNMLVLQSIIQIHVERCLDKAESQQLDDTKAEDDSEDQNTSYDLLCTTPDIIEGSSSPDIVNSTPQREQDENISTRSMRSKKGTK